MQPPPDYPYPPPDDRPSPVPYISRIGKTGQSALWATYVIFVVATLLLSVLAARLHVKHRALHLIALVITGVAALSYYAMATHSGVTYVPMGWRIIQDEETLVVRQVFWARYINWAITSPLIILVLSILAGLPWVDVVLVSLSALAGVLSATFGSLLDCRETVKWGWYAHACVFLILIVVGLLWKGRQCAQEQHVPVWHAYIELAVYSIFLAVVYFIVFALAEGQGILSVNSEVMAYAVLDVLSRATFGIWLVVAYRYDDEDNHIARFSDAWTDVRGRRGVIQLSGGEE